MPVEAITTYRTPDRRVFENKLEADEHDLLLSIGSDIDHLHLSYQVIASCKQPDFDAAFRAALDGQEPLPAEIELAALWAVFHLARQRSDAEKTEKTEKPADAPPTNTATPGLSGTVEALNAADTDPRPTSDRAWEEPQKPYAVRFEDENGAAPEAKPNVFAVEEQKPNVFATTDPTPARRQVI